MIRNEFLESRKWDSICVTKVLYGEGILGYDDCAMAQLLKPPIFPCNHVRTARIELWILFGFLHGIDVQKLSLVIRSALFFFAFLSVG
jgi:hypothetical protein